MKEMDAAIKYADIIDLPRHISPGRPQMPIADRAAQFSPFAALTGHDAAVKETARLTQDWIELTEGSKEYVNRQLQEVKACIKMHPNIAVTYFCPDDRKSGGEYISMTGKVKKINEYERYILLEDETLIPIDMIFDINVLLP
jgi:hypothetical protein